jgi:elongation factor P
VILASDLRKGTKILVKGEPYIVVDYQQVKPGKGGAFMRTKMKNLITGLMYEDTFRSEEKLSQPDLETRSVQYLYVDDGQYQFMDQESFEQISMSAKQLGDVVDYLREQTIYEVLNFSGRPITVTPPLHMQFTVVSTPPGVRGDTAQGAAMKPATLDTGLVVQVPLFVDEGDLVKVDTRDGRYIERVSKK